MRVDILIAAPTHGLRVGAAKMVVMTLAITSLSDVGRWARGSGLEIVMLIVGSILLTRFVAWFGKGITARIDAQDQVGDALVRSEAAKHRHSVTEVVTWTALVLTYFVTALLVK